MEALVLIEEGRLTVQERELPKLGPSDVLLKIEATGICGSDVHGYTGETGRRHPGQVMGHEIVGRVVEVGADPGGVTLGTLACVNPVMSCGDCGACTAGQEQACASKRVLGVVPDWDAGFAEFMRVPAANIVALPEGMLALHGTLVEPLSVGYHAACVGGVGPDDRVLVIGGGPIGQASALAAERLGSQAVVVSEPSAHRRDLLMDMGFVAAHPDALEVVLNERGAESPSVVIDAVGSSSTLSEALRLCAPQGTVVLVGMAERELTVSSYAISVSERRIVGSFCYSARHFRETADWVASNPSRIDRMIDCTATLGEAPDVFRRLAEGTLIANKVLIQPSVQ